MTKQEPAWKRHKASQREIRDLRDAVVSAAVRFVSSSDPAAEERLIEAVVEMVLRCPWRDGGDGFAEMLTECSEATR